MSSYPLGSTPQMDLIFHLRREFDLTSSTTHLAASLFHRFFCQALLPELLRGRGKMQKGNPFYAELRDDRKRLSAPFLFLSSAESSPAASSASFSPSKIPSLGDPAIASAPPSYSSPLLLNNASRRSSPVETISSSSLLSSSLSSSSTFSSSCFPPPSSSSSPSSSLRGLCQRASGPRGEPRPEQGRSSSSSSSSSASPSLLRNAPHMFSWSPDLRLLFTEGGKSGHQVVAQPSCRWLRRALLSAATCTKLADVYNERSLEYYKTTNGDDYSHELNQWIHRLHFSSDCLNGHVWCCMARRSNRRDEGGKGDGEDAGDEQSLVGLGEREATEGKLVSGHEGGSEHDDEEAEEVRQEGGHRRRREAQQGKTGAPEATRSDAFVERDHEGSFRQEKERSKTPGYPDIADRTAMKTETQVSDHTSKQAEKTQESTTGRSESREQKTEARTWKQKEKEGIGYVSEEETSEGASAATSPTRERHGDREMTADGRNLGLPGRRTESIVTEEDGPCNKKVKVEELNTSRGMCRHHDFSISSTTQPSTTTHASSSSQRLSNTLSSSAFSSSRSSVGVRTASSSVPLSSSSSSSSSSSRPRASRPPPPPPPLSSLFFSPPSAPVHQPSPASPVSLSSCAWVTPVSCRDIVEAEKEILLALSFRLAVSTSAWCLSILWSITDQTIKEIKGQVGEEEQDIERRNTQVEASSSLWPPPVLLGLPSARSLAKCRRYSEVLADISLYNMSLAEAPPFLLAQLLHLSALYNFFPGRFWGLLLAEASLLSSLHSSSPFRFRAPSRSSTAPPLSSEAPDMYFFSSSSSLSGTSSAAPPFFSSSPCLFDPLSPLLGPLMLPISRRLLCGRYRSVHTLLKLLECVEELPTVVRAHQELRDSPLFRLSADLAPAPLSFLKFCAREHEKTIINLRVQSLGTEAPARHTPSATINYTDGTVYATNSTKLTSTWKTSQPCEYTREAGSTKAFLSTAVDRESSGEVAKSSPADSSCRQVICVEDEKRKRRLESLYSVREKLPVSCIEEISGTGVKPQGAEEGTPRAFQEDDAGIQPDESAVCFDKPRRKFLVQPNEQTTEKQTRKLREEGGRVETGGSGADVEKEKKRKRDPSPEKSTDRSREAGGEETESQHLLSPRFRDGLPKSVLTLLLPDDNPSSLRILLWSLGKYRQL